MRARSYDLSCLSCASSTVSVIKGGNNQKERHDSTSPFRLGKISIGRSRHPKVSIDITEPSAVSEYSRLIDDVTASNENNYRTSVSDRETNTEITPQDSRQKRTLVVETSLPSASLGPARSLKYACKMNKMGVMHFQGNSRNTEKSLHFFMEAKCWFERAIDSQGGGEFLQSCDSPSVSLNQASPSSYIYQRVDFDEGMACYSDLLQIHKEPPYSFFPDHPLQTQCQKNSKYCSCLTSRNYLETVGATIMFNMGQLHEQEREFNDALILYQKALKLLTTNLSSAVLDELNDKGVDREAVMHPLAIPILNKIGQIQYKYGDLQSSLASYSSALHMLKDRSASKYSLDLAHTLNALGVLKYHESASDSAAALNYFQSALSIYKVVEGQHHSSVATVLNNIGRVHVHKNDYVTALEFYDEALHIRKERLGDDSLDYAATAFNAAQSLHQLGDLEHALWLYREFLHVAVKHFSINHRDVAVVLGGMGQIHQEKGEYDLAENFFMQGLEAARTALGDYHSEVAMMLNRLGNFYFERKLLDKAIQYYSQGLAIEVKVFDICHPNILVTLSNLGEIFRQRQEWAKAVDIYMQVLEIQRVRGNESPEVASTLYTLGVIHDQKGDEKSALRYLREALHMRQSVLGESHEDVASTLSSIGSIFYRSNSLAEAMDIFQKCLTIRRQIHGLNHRDVALAMYNIALVHQKKGLFSDAIEVFSEVLRIEKICLGDDHRDVAITLFKLGEVHRTIDDYDRALNFYERSLAIERRTSHPDVVSIARTLNEIGNMHLVRGETNQMMLAFNEASRSFRQAGLSPDNLAVTWQHFPFIVFDYTKCSAPAA